MGWNSACDIQYAASRRTNTTDAKHFQAGGKDPRNTRDEASMKRILMAGAVALVAGALGLGAAGAQTQTRVDAKQDWSIFQAGDQGKKVCWIVSQPTRTAAFRNGKSVQVRRGDIYLMVSIRPGDGVQNEISYLGGYPFKPGSKVEASVGSDKFSLFTEGENAWAPSAKEDGDLVDAFRRGSSAKLEGVSSRGTSTVDTFSLSGFSAALDAAAALCK
jgi:invasion protein IalB